MKHQTHLTKRKPKSFLGKILFILFFSMITQFQQGFGQLITEPFNYTPSGTNGLHLQSSGVWTVLNSGDSILVTAGNLSYTGLFASSGNSITYGGAGSEDYRIFTNQTTGTVYASFLLNVTTLGTLSAS